jgi:hypothetical protein
MWTDSMLHRARKLNLQRTGLTLLEKLMTAAGNFKEMHDFRPKSAK